MCSTYVENRNLREEMHLESLKKDTSLGPPGSPAPAALFTCDCHGVLSFGGYGMNDY